MKVAGCLVDRRSPQGVISQLIHLIKGRSRVKRAHARLPEGRVYGPELISETLGYMVYNAPGAIVCLGYVFSLQNRHFGSDPYWFLHLKIHNHVGAGMHIIWSCCSKTRALAQLACTPPAPCSLNCAMMATLRCPWSLCLLTLLVLIG